MAKLAVLSCLLLVLIASSASADARHLLHKHHKQHHKHGWKHGHCKTIAQVLHETPSLSRFAKAFDDAHVPFLAGLVSDPHARATFLAVQDDHLGSGDTVFDEAPIRFQQHAIMDRVKTCKAKDGDVYSTLASTKLTVVKDSPAHKGRKLQQVSTAVASLLDQLLPGDEETVYTSPRPVSNAAFALPEGQPEGRPLPRPDHEPEHKAHHGDHDDEEHEEHHGPKHGKHHGDREEHDEERQHGKHGKRHNENDDDDHHSGHGGWHGKGHGKEHGKWHGKHYEWAAKDMVAHALSKAERNAAKHGALYLQSNVTSQRVKVLGSVHACEATVLIVSAFLNAPPTPDLVAVLAAQQPYITHKAVHAAHHEHHHHPEHHHSWLGCLKHALKVWEHRLEHVLSASKSHVKHCKHGKRHGKHAKIHKHDPPNDPELLAYYAAHERSEVEHPGLGAQLATEEAAGIDAVEAAVAKVGRVAVHKLPATDVAQVQRLADPRAITFQEVNHTPLVLPSAAAEAWRELRNLLSGGFW